MATFLGMKRIVAPLAAALIAASPVLAQGEDDGFDLMEEGSRMILRGLMSEMEPALSELQDRLREWEPDMRMFVTEMGPALSELAGRIDDIRYYDTPEMLDNGDIVIRRRPDAPPYVAPEDEAPEIDL